MLGILCGHREGVVGQLVVTGRVGLNGDRVGSSPLLSVYDGCQSPHSVGLIANGQMSMFLASYGSGEVKGLYCKNV